MDTIIDFFKFYFLDPVGIAIMAALILCYASGAIITWLCMNKEKQEVLNNNVELSARITIFEIYTTILRTAISYYEENYEPKQKRAKDGKFVKTSMAGLDQLKGKDGKPILRPTSKKRGQVVDKQV